MRADTGIQHQIIAAACSIDHARQVSALYEECGYRAAEIHSDMEPDDREAVLERLRLNQLDCIVQVQMLGEGFDHPAAERRRDLPAVPQPGSLHPVHRPGDARRRPERPGLTLTTRG